MRGTDGQGERRPGARDSDSLCADARCEHPQGWHRKGVGGCLECGCAEFEQKPSLVDALRKARDNAAAMEEGAPNESEATYFNGRVSAFQEAIALADSTPLLPSRSVRRNGATQSVRSVG